MNGETISNLRDLSIAVDNYDREKGSRPTHITVSAKMFHQLAGDTEWNARVTLHLDRGFHSFEGIWLVRDAKQTEDVIINKSLN